MQDIHNYIPRTIHVSKVYTIAAILTLQLMVHVLFAIIIIIIIVFE